MLSLALTTVILATVLLMLGSGAWTGVDIELPWLMFFSGMLVLLLMVHRQMVSLQALTALLSRLSHRDYDGVEKGFSSLHSRTLLPGELHRLSEQGMSLARTLRQMEQGMAEQTAFLQQSLMELVTERDFIATLMDASPVLIITLDAERRVVTANGCSEKYIGVSEEQLRGRRFESIVRVAGLFKEVIDPLDRLVSGELRQYRHETGLVGTSGKDSAIAWHHSRITHPRARPGGGRVMVLAVGLDMTERKEAEKKLSWIAEHDALTGLYNHHRFQQELAAILASAIRYQRQGALLFLDLDHFKYINDSSGHHAGDEVLRQVSRELEQLLRATDVLARLGGDEFVIVLPEAAEKDAMQVAFKINQRISALSFDLGGGRHRVGASIGIAMYPRHGTTTQQLLANADVAMYQAKHNGRCGWHMFRSDGQTRDEMPDRMQWQRRLRQALNEDRFVLLFQPVMDLATGRIGHYEVLVRLLEEGGSLVSPTAFLPAVESSGMIDELDRLVIRKTILHQARLRAAGHDLNFFINISGHAIHDNGLLQHVQTLLEQTGVNPQRLIFEVTETVAVSDLDGAHVLMDRLHAQGCRTALDYFGVGFSSFYYLRQLPIDFVKIDGSFIHQLHSEQDERLFVRALCDVARGFGRKTVAEHVENEAILEVLEELGVDYAQGYHVGRPAVAILQPGMEERFSPNIGSLIRYPGPAHGGVPGGDG